VGTSRSADARVVVLSAATTSVERGVLARWLEQEWGSVSAQTKLDVVDQRDPHLEEHLSSDDDPLVMPIGVAWLPRARGGDRIAGFTDLVSLSDPWHPRPSDQARIASREPDRCRVIVGEPARVSELRRRWRARGGVARFGTYVARQATLALERAQWAIVGHRYKVPRLVIEQIEDRPRFQKALAEIARSTGRSPQSVKYQDRACLREMVTAQTPLGIDLFYGQLGWLATGGLDVDVDERQLAELRALGRRHALVFLPSHKSYVDPELLGRSLQRHAFPPNILVGGINLNFWPIGTLARRAGMMFIRRSFRDDLIYKLALHEYIAFLVRERFNLEWYIEGGRTRTGKLRLPRLGLLGYLADAVCDDGDDVYLVPTAIAFEQLYELKAMVVEAVGAKKQAESWRWFLDYVRAQYRSRGRVWIRFGAPLSLRQALEAEEAGADDPARARENAVRKTAFEVCHRINRATPITPTSLVTLALLGVEDRALTLPEIGATLEPLLEYVAARQLPLVGGLAAGEEAPIRDALRKLEQQGVVRRFTEGIEPIYAIGENEHLVAAFYRNSAIHFFVNRAIVETVLAGTGAKRLTDASQLLEAVQRLRDLLKYEFIFPSGAELAADVREEMQLFVADWECQIGDPERVRGILEHSRLHVAHRVLRSFLEAYQVVADHLAAQIPGTPFDESVFLSQCLGIARQYRLQHRIWSTESISQELFGNAIAVARSRGLLAVDGADVAARRRELAEEIADHVAQIATIRDYALRDLRELLRERRERGRRHEGAIGWIDPAL
jgi:glycerol-3-phosphate O-acyltransferase